MKNCSDCGKQIPEGQEMCPSCKDKQQNLSDVVIAHINLLKKKIEKEPSNMGLRIELGDLYQKHGLHKEALDQYQKVIGVAPNDFDTQMKSARIYLKNKELGKAENAFRAALHLAPKSTESLIGLFRTYYLQNKTTEAIVLGEKIVEAKPNSVEFRMLLKNLYNKKGDQEKTLVQLEKLEPLVPKSEQIIKEIVLIYKYKNNMEKVIEYYHKMLNKEIEDPDLGFHICRYYIDNKEYDKAIKHLKDLLLNENITSPMATMVRTYLALAFLKKDEIRSAESLVDEIQPSAAQHMNAETQKQLALLFFKIGQDELQNNRKKKAVAFFEKAVSFDKETVEYEQKLETTKNEITILNKESIKKILYIAAGTIGAFLFIVLIYVLVRNRIVIHVKPADGVAVLIDGKPVATQTEGSGIISSPVLFIGKHDIVIEKTGYETWQGAAGIGIGRQTKLEIELVPIHAFLRLVSVPELADVIIDGQFVGKTPFASDKILACPHVIELKHAGHLDWHADLKVNEKDSIDFGVIKLKNLAGKWYGKLGEDTYAYNAAFSMTVTQTNTAVTIKFYHKPREDCKYTGKIHGRIENGEFYAEGKIAYKYKKMFHWVETKKEIIINGEISDDWNGLEGKYSIGGLAEQNWWTMRTE